MILSDDQRQQVYHAASIRGVSELDFCRLAERDGEDPLRLATKILKDKDLSDEAHTQWLREKATAGPRKKTNDQAASPTSQDLPDRSRYFEIAKKEFAQFEREFTDAAEKGDADAMIELLDSSARVVKVKCLEEAFEESRSSSPRMTAIIARGLANLAMTYAFHLSKVHKARREQLERRLTALEHRKSFEYCGVFAPGETYEKGDFVTYKGALWHCHVLTSAVPGTSHDWQWAVRRGRDGRAR